MPTFHQPFSGFAVADVPAALTFYRDVLGLDASEGEMGIGVIHLGGGHDVIFYPKGDDHEPASFTILNLPVDDVGAAVAEMTGAGIDFVTYEGAPQDEHGVMRGYGPDIAWFTDPSGNVFSVIAR
ncbi:VOC family protein [Aeromicrobium sp. Leaf350]|uniref:VOC family protein n=1 Tax=Aeromicrobium sp. Leaf350 TaxID=2876565 RepID=UPI001E446C3A|nr:VOC family protein [Aeromicrobium sp. Leaf350]